MAFDGGNAPRLLHMVVRADGREIRIRTYDRIADNEWFSIANHPDRSAMDGSIKKISWDMSLDQAMMVPQQDGYSLMPSKKVNRIGRALLVRLGPCGRVYRHVDPQTRLFVRRVA